MFSYDELLDKYNALLEENKNLKNQVSDLKAKLGMPVETEEVVVKTSDTGINKYSSTTEKILLYRSLFCGREDVFARRWYSKTTDKSGYQPVCENEWADGLCDKRKYKCLVCPNRKLSPLTDEDIYKHGSVNFLSFGTHEESIMRFENSDVAHQLMDTIL